MSDAYEQFVTSKLVKQPPTGLTHVPELPASLFPFQADLVRWALKRGRCALFTATGTGKMRMELCFGDTVHREAGHNVLLLTHLGVAPQIVREAEGIGINVVLADDDGDVRPGITITNYDRVRKFDPTRFGAVILDEGQILKGLDGKTRAYLTESFALTPFRLSATATPAPNDWVELGQQAEFLGICKRSEMLAEFFINDTSDTGEWQLKGHGRKAFWRWLASWAAVMRSPADLGYDATGYELPPLEIHTHLVEADASLARENGLLFPVPALGLSEVRKAKRQSLSARVAKAAQIISAEPDEQWLVFGELNDETSALAEAIPGAVQVAGSDDRDVKTERLLSFADGGLRVLVSKTSIAGAGLNFQRCARVLFVGAMFSWEQWHQSIRRCWRYKQTRPVHVHLICGERETSALQAIERKEAQAKQMLDEVIDIAGDVLRSEIRGCSKQERGDYVPAIRMSMPSWLRSEVV